MNRIIFTLGVWLFPAACTALGAAGVFLLRRQTRPATRRILCGMAAGIMLAASVWSLLLPAIQRGQTLPLPAWIPSAVGLVLGAVGLLQVEQFAGQLLAGGAGHGGRMVLAVTLHNLPEGMAVGVVLAGFLAGDPTITLASVVALSLGIAIQNVPEGAVVSLPLTANGMSRPKAFLAGTLCGAVEPVGAVLMVAITGLVTPLLPYVLAFAAGAMMYVVTEELIPQTQQGRHTNIGTIGVAFGFVLMMVLDVALG